MNAKVRDELLNARKKDIGIALDDQNRFSIIQMKYASKNPRVKITRDEALKQIADRVGVNEFYKVYYESMYNNKFTIPPGIEG